MPAFKVSSATRKWSGAVLENYRRRLLRRFPYAVFYEHTNGIVTVYCIFHTSRDPAKWRRRLSVNGADVIPPYLMIDEQTQMGRGYQVSAHLTQHFKVVL